MAKAKLTDAEIVARWGEVVARYNSLRTPENVYDVRRRPDGALNCNCPGWRFQKRCRHVTRVMEGLDDDSAVAEKQARRATLEGLMKAARLDLADTTDGYYQVYNRVNASANEKRAQLMDRLLGALDASGLFAATERRPEAPRSRGVRLITLDDE